MWPSWSIGLAVSALLTVTFIAAVALQSASQRRSRARHRQALEIHDNVVQGLVRVQLALDLSRGDEGAAAIDDTLAASKRIVTGLLGDRDVKPGDLRRATHSANAVAAQELQDNVVQGLVQAKLALDLGRRDEGARTVAATLESAKHVITGLLGQDPRPKPGSLRRRRPA